MHLAKLVEEEYLWYFFLSKTLCSEPILEITHKDLEACIKK